MAEKGRGSFLLGSLVVVLYFLVGLAFLLRVYRLDAQSFWYDEAFTAFYAKAGIEALFRDVPAENHPPLHFLIAQLWQHWAGSSEFSLRFLSVLFGVASIPLVFKVVLRLFDSENRGVGLLSALFLAVSPLHVWYSQEARMYSLATFLGLFSLYFLIRALQNSSLWLWAPYALFTVLGAFTHFYFVFLVVAEAAVAIYWLLREPGVKNKRVATAWVGSQFSIAVFLLPLGVRALFVWDANSTFWSGPLDFNGVLWQTVVSFADGNALVGPFADGSAFAWTVFYALGITTAGLKFGYKAQHRNIRPVFLAALVIVPLIVMLLVSFSKPKMSPRYLLFSLPVFYMAVSTGIWGTANLIGCIPALKTAGGLARNLVNVTFASALLVAPALSLGNLYFDGRFARDDFRGLVGYVESEARPGDSVIVVGGHAEVAYDYYQRLSLPVFPVPQGHLPDISRPIGPEIVDLLNDISSEYQRVWLVRWQSELADPANHVLHQLSLNTRQQMVERRFQGLQLYLFDLDLKPVFKAEPDIQWKVGRHFEDGLEFLGFDVDKLYVIPGDSIGVTLYWRANKKLSEDLTAFIHLLNDGNSVVAQVDKRPVNDFYTTKQWQIGQIMRDEYYLKVPRGTPPGRYTLEAGIYRTIGGDRLTLTNGGDDRIILLRPDVGQMNPRP